MLDVFGTDDVAAFRGRWLRVRYSQSFAGQPARPLLTFRREGGGREDHVLPAAVFGRARWTGWAPPDLVRIEIAADLSDRAEFRLDGLEAAGAARLLWSGVARHPSGLVDAALWPFRDLRQRRLSLQRLLDLEPLERIGAFAAGRSRPVEWHGLESGLAAGSDEILCEWVLVLRPGAALAETLRSLAGSAHVPGWRLRVATDDRPRATSAEDAVAAHGLAARVVVEVAQLDGSGESAEIALAARSTAPFVGGLRTGDRFAPEAMAATVAALREESGLAMLYADSAAIDGDGRTLAAHLKPDWSPDFFRGVDYVGRPNLVRTSLLRKVARTAGGSGWTWRQVVQAVGEGQGRRTVRHLRRVLLGRRTEPEVPAWAPAAAVLAEPREPVPATVVIPTRNRADLLRRAVDSVIALTPPGSYQLVVVDNGSQDTAALYVLDSLRRKRDILVVEEPGAFNFSRLVNRGAALARHDVVVLLNNDCEVLAPDWLARLTEHAIRPETGAVGARLLYADGRLQHAGIGIGLGGFAGHRDRGRPADHPGHLGRLRVPHEVSAVTAACLAVETRKYRELGGFDEAFAVAFNDVDFCLRLDRAGYRNLLVPGVVLRHAESATRGRDRSGAKRARFVTEASLFAARWRTRIQNDPYTHPAFAIDRFWDQLG